MLVSCGVCRAGVPSSAPICMQHSKSSTLGSANCMPSVWEKVADWQYY